MRISLLKYFLLTINIASFLPVVIYWMIGCVVYLNLVISGKMSNKNDFVIIILLLLGAAGLMGLISSLGFFRANSQTFMPTKITCTLLFIGTIAVIWQLIRAINLSSEWYILAMFAAPTIGFCYLLKRCYDVTSTVGLGD